MQQVVGVVVFQFLLHLVNSSTLLDHAAQEPVSDEKSVFQVHMTVMARQPDSAPSNNGEASRMGMMSFATKGDKITNSKGTLGQVVVLRCIFVLAVIGVICYVILLCSECNCLWSRPGPDLLLAVAGVGASFCGTLRQAIFHEFEEDADVLLGCAELRLDILRKAALFLLDFLAPLVMLLVIMSTYDGIWFHMNEHLIELYLRQWDFVGITLSFAACILVVAVPSWVTPRSIKTYYIADTARVLCVTLTIADCHTMLSVFPVHSFLMILWSLVCGEVWFTTLVNAIACSMQCIAYVLVANAEGELEAGCLYPRHVLTYISRQALAVVAAALLSSIFQKSLANRVQSTQRACVAADSEVVVLGLLSVLCDAVVHLDQEFRISKPAPKLELMLMKDLSVPFGLEGCDFMKYLAGEDDRQRLRELVSRTEPAQSANVRFKVGDDGQDRSYIGMKLFTSTLDSRSGGGQLGYVIGVCETEEKTMDTIFSTGNGASIGASAISPAASGGESCSGAAENSSIADQDIILPLRTKSSRRTRGQSRKCLGAGGEFAVIVDALCPRLTILGYSPDFAFLCGLAPSGSVLLDSVSDSERFLAWVQSHANSFATGGNAGEAPSLSVTLQPPLAAHLGVEFHAVMAISLEDMSKIASSAEADTFPVRITLHKVRRVESFRSIPHQLS